MENIQNLVKKELELVDKELFHISVNHKEFNEELNSFLKSPKKRIRSLTALLYLKALSKEFSPQIIDILTAGELIHNASILHDDVIDNAEIRRGDITISKKFSPEISILTGDFLLSFATSKLMNIKNFEVLNIFLECTKQMSEAEINQYFLRGKMPELEEYIKIAEGKTASLFEAIFASCAHLSGISVEKSKTFAKNFGILFQLKNDIDSFSAEADKKNKIYTPKDFLGVEKTIILIDNYKKEIRRELLEIPENTYKTGLEDLLNII